MRSFKARLEPGQILMPLHHLAHDDQGGRLRLNGFRLLRQRSQGSDMDALPGRGALRDQSCREIGGSVLILLFMDLNSNTELITIHK